MTEKIITVEKLREKLNNRENVFILDVRPVDQRNEWHIAGSTHIDAYKRLNAGDNSVLDKVNIPENSTVVTVCAAGRTSLIASKALQEKGVNAYSLQGGMKAWNYAWNTAELSVKNARIIQIRRTAKGVLSYLVGSEHEAIVIDAALEPEIYQSIASTNGWKIKFVIDTHIHADYVSRTRDLAKAAKATHLMIDNATVKFDFVPVAPNEALQIGKARLEFLHTPGHTWESTIIKLGDEVVFTGDTLFIDGIGRPDLKAEKSETVEKARALYHSLKRILALNPETIVLPAHSSNSVSFDSRLIADTLQKIGSKLTIADLGQPDFIEYALSRIPPTPLNYVTIATINKQGSYDGHVLADLEAGGNHCAIA
jgi:glyoxylase-like metal-dependent hydrolase (beta-lactamase superfamily II)/rhodanese-related sulfurtransferase